MNIQKRCAKIIKVSHTIALLTLITHRRINEGTVNTMSKEKQPTIRKTLDLPADLSQHIDDYQDTYHFASNSQAIIQLVTYGLMYTRKIEEQSLHPLYTGPK